MDKQLVEGLIIGGVVGHMLTNSKKPTDVELIQQSILADDLARMSTQEKRVHLYSAQQRQAASNDATAKFWLWFGLIALTIFFWYVMIPLELLVLAIYCITKIFKLIIKPINNCINQPLVQISGSYIYVLFATIFGGLFLSSILMTILFVSLEEYINQLNVVVVYVYIGFNWIVISGLILRHLLTTEMGIKFTPISHLIGKIIKS